MKNTEFIKMVTDAVDKLLVQNKQSVAPFGDNCKYRGQDKTCCIVGFMMDEKTALLADSEGNSGIGDIVRKGVWDVDLSKDQISFLMDLQAIHDIIPEEGFDFNHSFIKEVKSAGNLHWVAEHIDNKEVK
jgi:hypothetical protein